MMLEQQTGRGLGIDIRNGQGIAFGWDPIRGTAEILATCRLSDGWDRERVYAEPEGLGEVLQCLDRELRSQGILSSGYVLGIPDHFEMQRRMQVERTAEQLEIPILRMIEESSASAIYACTVHNTEGHVLAVSCSRDEIACSVYECSGSVMEILEQAVVPRKKGMRTALALGMRQVANVLLAGDPEEPDYVLSAPSSVILMGSQRDNWECREFLQQYFRGLRACEQIQYLSGDLTEIALRGTALYAQMLYEKRGEFLFLNSMTPHRLFLQGGSCIEPIMGFFSIPFEVSISALLEDNPGREIVLFEEAELERLRPIRRWIIPKPSRSEEEKLWLRVDKEKRISLMFEDEEVPDSAETADDAQAPDTEGTGDPLARFMEVADSLEYGMQGIRDPEDAHLMGLKNIFRQIMDIFAAYGIERYGSVGETFDPQIHNAVYHITDIDLPEQSVQQVVQSGYRNKERILRYASVVVAN